MPLVFVLLAFLFWITVATLVAIARLSRDALQRVASLGHSARSPRRA